MSLGTTRSTKQCLQVQPGVQNCVSRFNLEYTTVSPGIPGPGVQAVYSGNTWSTKLYVLVTPGVLYLPLGSSWSTICVSRFHLGCKIVSPGPTWSTKLYFQVPLEVLNWFFFIINIFFRVIEQQEKPILAGIQVCTAGTKSQWFKPFSEFKLAEQRRSCIAGDHPDTWETNLSWQFFISCRIGSVSSSFRQINTQASHATLA